MLKKNNPILYKRQKIVLGLLQAFGCRLSNMDFQKYLFLYTKKCKQEKYYEFIPYKFGCFSFQSYADRRRLVDIKAIIDDTEFWSVNHNQDYTNLLDSSEYKEISFFVNNYKNLTGNDLIHYVYKNYPYYAINSEIADKLMSKEELLRIKNARSFDENYAFYTIGYEGNSFENYLNRLIKNNVKLLCDVRKNPFSRKYGFSKTILSNTLQKLNIQYIHIPELGIVSEERQNLKTENDYNYLFDEYEKSVLLKNKKNLDYLHTLFLQNKRVAITCFEADYCMCHRGRIAKALENKIDWHHKIKHI